LTFNPGGDSQHFLKIVYVHDHAGRTEDFLTQFGIGAGLPPGVDG